MARKSGNKLNQVNKQKKFWIVFGAFIRQKRLEVGLTEFQVSEYLGTSSSVILGYEMGDAPIPLNRVYALANCLNISPELVVKKIGSWTTK